MENLLILLKDWIYGYAILMLGFALFKLLSFSKREKKEIKFNIKYWIVDNWKEFAIINILFIVSMLFFEDIRNILNNNIGLTMITNKYFLLFLIGLFFTSILNKMRSFLKLNSKIYPDGSQKNNKNYENDFVGERPDDR